LCFYRITNSTGCYQFKTLHYLLFYKHNENQLIRSVTSVGNYKITCQLFCKIHKKIVFLQCMKHSFIIDPEYEAFLFGRTIVKTTTAKNPRKKSYVVLMLLLVVLLGAITKVYDIQKERESKKQKEIESIKRNANKCKDCCEQYMLIARTNGWYPCYNCQDSDSIFLLQGEVWKYGKTCNGKDKRYGDKYLELNRLFYREQFRGTEEECLIMEKQKIYAYPSLPECLKRDIFLVRPPGNRIDR